MLAIALFSTCKTNKEKHLAVNEASSLKDYQQYALNRIMEADADNQGFTVSDSFYLWSWEDFGGAFNQNRITRTRSNGFYRFTFWAHLRDTAIIYAEDSIPVVQLLKDTVFDANGDSFKDFVAIHNPNNGVCPPNFTMLFLMDSLALNFKRIEAIDEIPNDTFHRKKKTVTSEIICDMYKENYKFKWNKDFGIDTIYSRIVKL